MFAPKYYLIDIEAFIPDGCNRQDTTLSQFGNIRPGILYIRFAESGIDGVGPHPVYSLQFLRVDVAGALLELVSPEGIGPAVRPLAEERKKVGMQMATEQVNITFL